MSSRNNALRRRQAASLRRPHQCRFANSFLPSFPPVSFTHLRFKPLKSNIVAPSTATTSSILHVLDGVSYIQILSRCFVERTLWSTTHKSQLAHNYTNMYMLLHVYVYIVWVTVICVGVYERNFKHCTKAESTAEQLICATQTARPP